MLQDLQMSKLIWELLVDETIRDSDPYFSLDPNPQTHPLIHLCINDFIFIFIFVVPLNNPTINSSQKQRIIPRPPTGSSRLVKNPALPSQHRHRPAPVQDRAKPDSPRGLLQRQTPVVVLIDRSHPSSLGRPGRCGAGQTRDRTEPAAAGCPTNAKYELHPPLGSPASLTLAVRGLTQRLAMETGQ